jgi:hypothetical protein
MKLIYIPLLFIYFFDVANISFSFFGVKFTTYYSIGVAQIQIVVNLI